MSHFARIDALIASGQLDEAHALAVESVQLAPGDADAVFYRAKCEWALQDLAAARASLAELASLDAGRFAAFHLLKARVHASMNEPGEALAALQQAAALDRDDPEPWMLLAQQWSAAGEDAEALAAWTRYAERAQLPAAWVHLGRLHALAGRVDPAVQAYRQALAIDAADTGALRALASLAAETFDFTTASSCLGRLLEQHPGDEGALNLLGFVEGERGEDRMAIQALRMPGAGRPSASRRARAALYLPQVTLSREHIADLRSGFIRGLEELENDHEWITSEADLFSLAHTNFLLAYHGEDDLPLQRRYARLVRSRVERHAPQWLDRPARRSRTRIRVGFLSSFFRQCTIGNYFEHWVTGLDATRFERFVFSTGWQPDALGERLRIAADRFDVLRGGALDVARAVRAADLDVLVYPEIGMGAQNGLLAHLRLAPVQCAAWGHPVTTGSAEIDAYLSCAAMEPEGAAAHYSERLWTLPGIGTCYARPGARAAFARESMKLPAQAHLYACPQSLFKIHPDNDDVFLDIIERDTHAIILFFQAMYPAIGATFSRRIALAAERRGIDARGRFRFVPRQSEAGFRAILAACDVVLDTLHWSGGNTSLDAMAVAAPIVTLPGSFMRGRQTMAMLTQAGVADLIAIDRADYVDKAVAIAGDAAWRTALRARLVAGSDAVFGQRAPLGALGEVLEALARQ